MKEFYINVKGLDYYKRIKILQKLKKKFPTLTWNNEADLVSWYKKTYFDGDTSNYFYRTKTSGLLITSHLVKSIYTELKFTSIKDKLK